MPGRALLTSLVFAMLLTVSAGVTAAPMQPSEPTEPTPLRVRGTIERYDTKGAVLVLMTSTGPVRFTIGSNARIRVDGHHVSPSVLRDLSGRRAAVRYADAGGHPTVQSVSVSRTGGRTTR